MQHISKMWRECRLLRPSREYATGRCISLRKKLLLAFRASEVVKKNLKVTYGEAVQRIVSDDWEPLDDVSADLPAFPAHQCGLGPRSSFFFPVHSLAFVLLFMP